jgi:hypothetical protein
MSVILLSFTESHFDECPFSEGYYTQALLSGVSLCNLLWSPYSETAVCQMSIYVLNMTMARPIRTSY